MSLEILDAVLPLQGVRLEPRDDPRAGCGRGGVMGLQVVDVHDETVDDDRTVEPARRHGAVLGVLARSFVRVVRMADQDDRAVRALEDDVGHGARSIREPLGLAEAEHSADPVSGGAGVRVGEHRNDARLAHGGGQYGMPLFGSFSGLGTAIAVAVAKIRG